MPRAFWEQLLLQWVGPLVTAVIGTLIIGTFEKQSSCRTVV